jgi:hypothetical protein
MKFLPASVLLVLALPVRADVAYFVGPLGGAGALWIGSELGPVAPVPGFDALTLLPLDFHGRSGLEEWQPDRPRYRADIPGAARLTLPQATGCLYHYRRATNDGARYGFLHIDAAGLAHVHLEAAGSGPLLDQDPYHEQVAVSPDGASVLVATALDAGGDLLELRLVDGQVENRTAQLAPQSWQSGLSLRASMGAAVASDAVWRFARAPAAQAETVAFPAAPAYFAGELATSANGAWYATVAGAAAAAADVYVFGASGGAARATQSAAPISAAGFAPQHDHGPFLAVSDDGQYAAWRTEGPTREAWIGRVQAGPLDPPVHISSDANYLDTLDEIGLFGFTLGNALVLGVGKRADPVLGGLEALDLFRVSPPASGAVSLTNLSLSSGVAVAPFLVKGKLGLQLARRLPGSGDLLLADDDGEQLLRVSVQSSSAQVLTAQVKELNWIEPLPGYLLASLRRSTNPKTQDLVRIPTSAAAATTVLSSLPDVFAHTRVAVRGDGSVGFVLTSGLQEWVVALHVASGLYVFPTLLPLRYGSTLAFSPSGALSLATRPDAAGGLPTLLASWLPGGGFVLHGVQSAPAFVLPRN